MKQTQNVKTLGIGFVQISPNHPPRQPCGDAVFPKGAMFTASFGIPLKVFIIAVARARSRNWTIPTIATACVIVSTLEENPKLYLQYK